MVWKVINITDTGTASKFGADDTDKINKGFSGYDVDDYDINSDFKFRDGKLQLSNPANSFKYTINTSAILADRSLIIPLITGTDTLAVLSLAQTLSNKTLDSSCIISSSSSLPANAVKTDAANAMGDFDTSFKDNRIRIWNPADTFRYTLIAAAIGADRNLTLPLITGPDTLACLGLAQTFTDAQTMSKDTSTLLTIYRPTNTINQNASVAYDFQNSTPAQVNIGNTSMRLLVNTAGNEESRFSISCISAGSLITPFTVNEDSAGSLRWGSNNRRIQINDSGLTATRTIKMPNADSTILSTGTQSGAANDINTTNAEQDLLNYSIPANAMGANGSVRFLITGYLLQNQASGTTYTFSVKFGTTAMWTDVSPSIAQSATKIPFRIEGEVYNKNATNAQGCSGHIRVNDTTGATTGIGDIGSDTNTSPPAFSGNFDSEGADTTKDTTSAQTLQVTVTMSVSNSATHTVVKHKAVEVHTFA